MLPTTLEGVVLAVHIGAGGVALFAGVGALVTRKGGDRHRFAGRTFVRAMAVVVGSVLPLLALEPGSATRQFLTLVAVFSGYFAFSGYRVLSRKRPADDARPADWGAAILVVVACLALGSWGVALMVGGTAFGLVMVVFGGIGLAFGVTDLRRFRSEDRTSPWMLTHLARMMGAFIATVTAVSAVNLAAVSGIPTVVAWLWPTAVGVPLIWYMTATHAGQGPMAGVVSGAGE